MSALLDLTPVTVLHRGEVDASPPPRGEREGWNASISYALLAISVLLTWALVYMFVLSGFEQGRTQSAMYQDLRTDLALSTAPTSAPIDLGRPVALISIPAAGVDDVVVVEGSRPAQLQQGPGHVLGSVLPGQRGISVLAGRSLSYGGPFSRIDDLATGDTIKVTTAQGVFTYVVTGTREKGDPLPAALPDDGSRLTLVTADRGSAGLQAGSTVFVDATLSGDAAPAGAVAAPDKNDGRMSARLDVPTLAMLALALQLLVAALAAFAYAWRRWSRTATWIAVGPCVLGALWLASSIGTRLLPGLV